MASCSTSESIDPSNPYAAEFEASMDGASDYTRGILADGVITEAEFADMRSHHIQCLTDGGLDAKYEVGYDGTWQFSLTFIAGTETDAQRQTDTDCQYKWADGILSLYNAVMTNPRNEDVWPLVADCLIRHGLVPEGFSAKDAEEIWEQITTRVDENGNVTPAPGGGVVPNLPGSGKSLGDPDVSACRDNPQF